MATNTSVRGVRLLHNNMKRRDSSECSKLTKSARVLVSSYTTKPDQTQRKTSEQDGKADKAGDSEFDQAEEPAPTVFVRQTTPDQRKTSEQDGNVDEPDNSEGGANDASKEPPRVSSSPQETSKPDSSGDGNAGEQGQFQKGDEVFFKAEMCSDRMRGEKLIILELNEKEQTAKLGRDNSDVLKEIKFGKAGRDRYVELVYSDNDIWVSLSALQKSAPKPPSCIAKCTRAYFEHCSDDVLVPFLIILAPIGLYALIHTATTDN